MEKSLIAKLALLGSLLVASCALEVMAAEKSGTRYFPRLDNLPFASAVQVGDVLYLSGQLGVEDDEKSVVPGGMPAETRRMMELIGRTLKEHGLNYEDLFNCTVMLLDMRDWPEFNRIYAGYFKSGHYPARSAMGVTGLALGGHVEMQCWAYAPQKKSQ